MVLPPICRDLTMINYNGLLFCLKSNVENVSANFGLPVPDILYILVLRATYIDIVQDTGVLITIRLKTFHCAPLPSKDYFGMHTYNRYWDTLLESMTTPYMYKKSSFY